MDGASGGDYHLLAVLRLHLALESVHPIHHLVQVKEAIRTRKRQSGKGTYITLVIASRQVEVVGVEQLEAE